MACWASTLVGLEDGDVALGCREDGVLIRNLADTFVISPPLIVDTAHVDQMVDAFDRAVGTVERA